MDICVISDIHIIYSARISKIGFVLKVSAAQAKDTPSSF
jgi:hypothetical protein